MAVSLSGRTPTCIIRSEERNRLLRRIFLSRPTPVAYRDSSEGVSPSSSAPLSTCPYWNGGKGHRDTVLSGRRRWLAISNGAWRATHELSQ